MKQISAEQVRERLIKAGIRNLAEFGYTDVTEDNILTDIIYSGFFLSMLKDNLGNGFDYQINQLIAEIKQNQAREGVENVANN